MVFKMQIRGKRVVFLMTLPKELYDGIEQVRGPLPRTRFIESLIYDALKKRRERRKADK